MSSLTFSLIQSNLAWEDKKTNLSMFSDKIEGIEGKTEVVVLPEMFSTGFSMEAGILAEAMDGETINWMKNLSRKKNIILTGSLIIKENDQYFNRLVWMLPNGEFGVYDKRHLFAYSGEDNQFTAGCKRLITAVKGWKIKVQVCYDLRFPVWSRQTPIQAPVVNNEEATPIQRGNHSPEYDVLLYVANWPRARSHAWKTLLTARAIENQCYVIGVNRVGEDGNNISYSGDSMVIDPLGEILYQMESREDIHTVTLEKSHLEEIRKKFPFLRDADKFIIYP